MVLKRTIALVEIPKVINNDKSLNRVKAQNHIMETNNKKLLQQLPREEL